MSNHRSKVAEGEARWRKHVKENDAAAPTNAPAHATPPWGIVSANGKRFIVDANGFDICVMSNQHTRKFRNSATLIVSAPTLLEQNTELLEALKGVVAIADRKTVEFDKARATIAKCEAQVA